MKQICQIREFSSERVTFISVCLINFPLQQRRRRLQASLHPCLTERFQLLLPRVCAVRHLRHERAAAPRVEPRLAQVPFSSSWLQP